MAEKKPTEKDFQGLGDVTGPPQSMSQPPKPPAPPPAPEKKEPVKKAKGGYVKSADGCAKRGRTRGKMV